MLRAERLALYLLAGCAVASVGVDLLELGAELQRARRSLLRERRMLQEERLEWERCRSQADLHAGAG